MKKILLSMLALFVLAFAAFGFLASFEPLDPKQQIIWRTVYALLAAGALASLFALFRRRAG